MCIHLMINSSISSILPYCSCFKCFWWHGDFSSFPFCDWCIKVLLQIQQKTCFKNKPKEYPQQQQPKERVTKCLSRTCLRAGWGKPLIVYPLSSAVQEVICSSLFSVFQMRVFEQTAMAPHKAWIMGMTSLEQNRLCLEPCAWTPCWQICSWELCLGTLPW